MSTLAADLTVPGSSDSGAAPLRVRRRWGLRRRIMLTFTLGALLLSVVLAVITYGFARSGVVQQRDRTARESARTHATLVADALRASPPTVQPAQEQLEQIGIERTVYWYREQWTAPVPLFNESQLPEQLVARVLDERVASRMFVDVGSDLHLVVGFPLDDDAAFFEFFSLVDVTDTLDSVRLALLIGTVITTVLGVMAGSFAARRAVRPVGVAAQAAKAIAGGRLDTRLEPTDDPDLSVLAASFNDMAMALQTRIERDARFASDVSHELRSPLMTLSASVDVMEARRGEMPERAQAALDLLKSDVARFQGLVEDLLEISRFDAGAVRLHREELLVAEFVRHAVAISSAPQTPIVSSPRTEQILITGDRRRLARVIANLIDNARLHGGGEAEVAIDEVTRGNGTVTRVRLAVTDHGNGVPEGERLLIFERFARGGTAGRRAGNDGAGLGLALVEEHVRMHGGKVWGEDRPDGRSGARFVIELDAEEIDT
ncbi:MAG: HAMP domain-containing sensor histidine kinase [Ilumatobacteraceae bacterium]